METFTGYKIIALINKNLEPGVALNALGHIALGLGARLAAAQHSGHFLDFTDADGGTHPSVSGLPLIVLRGTSGNIRSLRNEAQARGLLWVDFVDTMTGGTWDEELGRTKRISEGELAYYGIITYGHDDVISQISRKFSLYK